MKRENGGTPHFADAKEGSVSDFHVCAREIYNLKAQGAPADWFFCKVDTHDRNNPSLPGEGPAFTVSSACWCEKGDIPIFQLPSASKRSATTGRFVQTGEDRVENGNVPFFLENPPRVSHFGWL